MGKFATFFLGVFCAILLLGGGAAYFLSGKMTVTTEPASAPTAAKDKVAVAPTPADAGLALPAATQMKPAPAAPDLGGLHEVYIDGTIVVPPALKKLVEGKSEGVFRIVASEGGQTGYVFLAHQAPLATVTFPFHYHLKIGETERQLFASRANVPLYVEAVACLGVKKETGLCARIRLPSLAGQVFYRASIQPSGKELVVKVPTVPLMNYAPPPSPEACQGQGETLAGSIQATPAFLSQPGRPKSFVLLALPYGVMLSANLRSRASPEPIKVSELHELDQAGIVHKAVTILDGKPVPVALKIPKATQEKRYALFLKQCQDGENEESCTASAFPIPSIVSGRQPGLIKLMPSGFELPACGSKGQVFYLHRWNTAAEVSEASMRASNPPELIEGATY